MFKAGQDLNYVYEIVNPQAEGQKTNVSTQVRLFRGAEVVYEGKVTPNASTLENNAKRMIVAGRFRLNKIVPGDYVLQVVAIDNLRKDKNRIAAQTIDFEVK